MNISLTKYKHYPRLSEETDCFVATICLDGKEVGTVENTGKGGCNSYYWNDRTVGESIEKFAIDNNKSEYNFGQLDSLITEIAIKLDAEKQYKSWCKKGSYFRLVGDKEGVWRTVLGNDKKKLPYNAGVKEWIKKNYSNVEEILNERYA